MKTQKETILNEIVEESQRRAAGIEKTAGRIAREARFVQDMGEITKTIVNAMDEDEMPADHGILSSTRGETRTRTSIVGGAASTRRRYHFGGHVRDAFTVSTIIQARYFIRSQEMTDRFYDLLSKDDIANEIKLNLIRLQLDKRMGEILSPFELFENAKNALDRPSGVEDAPVPITIQLRGCIDVILASLLKQRRTQEPATCEDLRTKGFLNLLDISAAGMDCLRIIFLGLALMRHNLWKICPKQKIKPWIGKKCL